MSEFFCRSFRRNPAQAARLVTVFMAVSSAFLAEIGLPQLHAQDAANGLADKMRARLLAEWKVLETWDETERSYQTQSETVLTDGKKRPTRRTIKVRPDHRLMIDSKFILARSHTYTFALARATPESEWALRYFTQGPPTPESLRDERGGMSIDDYFSMNPLSVFDSHLRVGEAGAALEFTVTQVTSGKDQIERIEYKSKRGVGYFLVDRGKSSLVIANHYRASAPGVSDWTVDFTRELDKDRGGQPAPRCKSLEFIMRDASTKSLLTQVRTEFSDYSDARVPDDEFRLSHYGMPEPIGVEWKKPTPNYVWFLIGAGVFAIIAVLFRYLARRTRAAPK